MKTGCKARQITLLGLLTAILLLMSYTPLGYLHIGPFAVTFNMIPVAVAAAALGPWGGAWTGAVFGLTSFGRCFGIGGVSPVSEMLFAISPARAFLVCFVPRLLTGFLAGLLYRCLKARSWAASAAGFAAAAGNTVLYMGALIVLYRDTPYLQQLMAGRSVLGFVCTFVGLQAVLELLVSTLITGALVRGLAKARLLER